MLTNIYLCDILYANVDRPHDTLPNAGFGSSEDNA